MWLNRKETEVGMDRYTRKGIQKVEEEVYKRTDISSIRFRLKK